MDRSVTASGSRPLRRVVGVPTVLDMPDERSPDPLMTPDTRQTIESWFIAEGVPHFIDGYSASANVLTRAAPVLVAYLVVTIGMTASFRFSVERNILAVAVATVIALGGWALLNVVRGRHWRSLPRRVGIPEVVAFLLLPAIAPLLVGMQVGDAVITVAESAVFLGIVYLATSYGLLAAGRWAVRRLMAQRGSLGRLLTRALPLLMIFIVFVFIQSDTWQVTYAMGSGGLAIVLVLFTTLSLLFLVGQLAPEIRRFVEGSRSWAETLAIARQTPALPLCDLVADAVPCHPPLRWHEWVNVGFVVVFGQGLQVLLVSVAVAVGLIVFGVVSMPAWLQEEWVGGPVNVLVSIELLGDTMALTTQLISVAVILAALSGLYFTVSALSDAAYRAEFFSDADSELERVVAVRSVYRTALEAPAPGIPEPASATA